MKNIELRDFLAGMAIAGLMANPRNAYHDLDDADGESPDDWVALINCFHASQAYHVADMMLYKREEPRSEPYSD